MPSQTDKQHAGTREEYTRAILNILEDFTAEKGRLEETQSAMLNIIEDFTGEKERLGKTQRAVLNILDDFSGERGRLEETQRATLNILEDFAAEKQRLDQSQRAVLNILDDFTAERGRLEETQRATLNILEDFTGEKERLEQSQRATINILDDFAAEKARLEESQRAMINILDDFAAEKVRLEESQRAMLNILADFDVERQKAEAANRELVDSIKAVRAAKEAADAYNRELEAFSYSVSHDLRTPLRSIDGYSKVLLEDYSDKLDEEGKESLNRIAANAMKMGQLIDDLLNLSRITRTQMRRERVNLSEVAKKIVRAFTESNPARRVMFKIAEGIFAECDGRLMMIVLDNLFSNAWKFTEKLEQSLIEFGTVDCELQNAPDGTIRGQAPCGMITRAKNAKSEMVTDHAVRNPKSEMVYFVRDNGAGFDMSYADRLFNPFQRLHKAEEFSGTGIGLATVKRIIDRHGGRVWIRGEVGKGTTVYFTL